MDKGSRFFTLSPMLVIFCLFYNNHTNPFGVISHCSYDLRFPDQRCEHFFILHIGHLYVFDGKKICIQLLSAIFIFYFLLLRCMSFLYFFDINSLSKIVCTYFLSNHQLPLHFVNCLLCRIFLLYFHAFFSFVASTFGV